jgi:hypothetical protein
MSHRLWRGKWKHLLTSVVAVSFKRVKWWHLAYGQPVRRGAKCWGKNNENRRWNVQCLFVYDKLYIILFYTVPLQDRVLSCLPISRTTLVGLVSRRRRERPRNRGSIPYRGPDITFLHSAETGSSIQRSPRALSPGVRLPEGDAIHSFPPSA